MCLSHDHNVTKPLQFPVVSLLFFLSFIAAASFLLSFIALTHLLALSLALPVFYYVSRPDPRATPPHQSYPLSLLLTGNQ